MAAPSALDLRNRARIVALLLSPGPPWLLDLFCGLGGAAKGYQRAGFRVLGVDVVDQPDYCGDAFVRADALVFAWLYARHFAAVHASPPCQGSSAPTRGSNAKRNAATGRAHPMLIELTRDMLEFMLARFGIPGVIENVQGAAVRRDLTLCGEMFGLCQIRHRYFELVGWTMARHACPGRRAHRGYVRGWRHGVYRDGPYVAVYGKGGGKATTEECRIAQGIDWSHDRAQLVEAIPPAYTNLIGDALLAHVTGEGAA